MSKYSPGLWTYSYTSAAAARAAANDGTDGGGGNGLIMARQPGPGQDPTIVAILPYHRDPSEDAEREANACLLAAAPDLLEAAIVQQECGLPSKVTMYDEDGCEGWVWQHPDGREWMEIGDWSEPPTLHPLMRTAIVKAKGERQ